MYIQYVKRKTHTHRQREEGGGSRSTKKKTGQRGVNWDILQYNHEVIMVAWAGVTVQALSWDIPGFDRFCFCFFSNVCSFLRSPEGGACSRKSSQLRSSKQRRQTPQIHGQLHSTLASSHGRRGVSQQEKQVLLRTLIKMTFHSDEPVTGSCYRVCWIAGLIYSDI